MEGAVFYWSCWMLWVYLTFILEKKNPYRLKLAVFVLLVIIFSNVTFMMGSYQINTSGLFLLIISYLFISQEKSRAIFYYFICSFILAIAYVTFHLFEIYDPIWIIFKKEWMMGICFGYLAILLQKNLKGRVLIVICGTVQGDFIYAHILNQYQFPYSIGGLEYLDVCSLISGLLVAWTCLENAGSILQNFLHFTERGKQKTS